jgi:peroxiredoxin
LAKQYADKGLVVVAPSLDAEAKVDAFVKKHEIDYPNIADAKKSAESFKVRAFPTMFLVSKDGKILWKGHFKNDALTQAIDKAVAEK